ncbi:ATP-binding protein [Nocardiopsis sp. CNT312]|uniref:ATP-binding protein n=1 Tax=Nocardiopsis sp. CNT312 TaxID=1137268 RepID=UPI00048D3F75|nr:ATP-binding protein [Nocardiopsis sp. CNT312]
MSLYADRFDHTASVHHAWFYGRPDQIAAVRAFVADRLGDCPVADDAVLLTSELATNAVQHTPSSLPGAGFGVLIEHEHGKSVRVTVHDGGSYFDAPCVAQPEPDAEHGRGLFLVDALATSWGSYATLSGRKTWFLIYKE